MNSVNIIGRLTRTPDLKRTANGTPVTSFSVAVNDYKTTTFVDVVAWRNTAEFICKYFTKGQLIAISGRLSNREYVKGDFKKTLLEVTAEKADFCESKGKTSENSVDDFEDLDDTEELPF